MNQERAHENNVEAVLAEMEDLLERNNEVYGKGGVQDITLFLDDYRKWHKEQGK